MLLVVVVRPPLPCCPLLLVSVCVIAVCAVTVCVVVCRVFVLLLLLLWWRLARSPPITRPGSARATPRISLWCAGSPAHHPGTSRFCSLLFCCAVCRLLLCCLWLSVVAVCCSYLPSCLLSHSAVCCHRCCLLLLSFDLLPFLSLIAVCYRLICCCFCCYLFVAIVSPKKNWEKTERAREQPSLEQLPKPMSIRRRARTHVEAKVDTTCTEVHEAKVKSIHRAVGIRYTRDPKPK